VSTSPAISETQVVPGSSLPQVKSPRKKAKENIPNQQSREEAEKVAGDALKYIEGVLGQERNKLDLASQKEFIGQAARLKSLDFALLRNKMAKKLAINMRDFEKEVDAARPHPAKQDPPAGDDQSDSILTQFNERYFVIENYGGKCHVCWIENDEELGRSIGHQSFEEFRHRFQHKLLTVPIKTPTGGTAMVEKSEADVWLNHRDRRQFEKIVFKPEEETPEHIYNLWQGFAYEPKEGDCSLYLAHLPSSR
jgi:hypothetical protein